MSGWDELKIMELRKSRRTRREVLSTQIRDVVNEIRWKDLENVVSGALPPGLRVFPATHIEATQAALL